MAKKKKEIVPVEVVKEDKKVVVEMTQEAFDAYYDDEAKTFQVVHIRYNPSTGDAKVVALNDAGKSGAIIIARMKQLITAKILGIEYADKWFKKLKGAVNG